MQQAFSQAFQSIYGRPPTQQEFDRYVADQRERARREQGLPPSQSTSDQIAALAGPVGGLAGMYLGSKLLGPAIGLGGSTAGAGAGAASATAAANSGAAAIGAGPTLAAVAPFIGGAAGLYGMYDLAADTKYKGEAGKKTAQGAASGAALGSAVPGVGTALGAAIGAALGFTSSQIGSGKDVRQVGRDSLREQMQELGLLDEEFTLEGVDLGKDGGFRFEDGRKIYEVIPGMESGAQIEGEVGDAVGALNPLGFIAARGHDDMQGYATGMLYNALSGGNQNDAVTPDEVRGLYQKAGLDQKTAFEGINLLFQSGRLTEDEARAAQNAINQTFGQEYYSPTDKKEYAELLQETRDRLFS